MVTINYRFSDGHCEDIEVTQGFAAKYAEFAQAEKRRFWRESKRKRHEVSLEKLTETGWDTPDPINCDPQDRDATPPEPASPQFIGLTEYQRRVAFKFFIKHETHEQIAREEKVSRQAITSLIRKIQNKVIDTLA
jgi:hypothetical protein